jgi:hypothetical protein
MKSILLILTVLILAATAAWAGEADVETVEAVSAGENSYGFQVTIRHADAGWDHYADRFEIVDGGGRILGTRILYHPHVNEQPFTRNLENVLIPPGIAQATVRAHDSRHGYGGRQVTLQLPDR